MTLSQIYTLASELGIDVRSSEKVFKKALIRRLLGTLEHHPVQDFSCGVCPAARPKGESNPYGIICQGNGGHPTAKCLAAVYQLVDAAQVAHAKARPPIPTE